MVHPLRDRPPLFAVLFFAIFGCIGVTVLVFLWGARGFGAPPLVFKVFGSFIALAFIVMGFGVPLSALAKRSRITTTGGEAGPGGHGTADRPDHPGGYTCPHCGANVADGEVSPSGDIKCRYCNHRL